VKKRNLNPEAVLAGQPQPLSLTHPSRHDWILEQKRPGDYWPTPAHAVESLLASCPPPSATVVEPCAGDGAIARVLLAYGYRVVAHELQPQFGLDLERSRDTEPHPFAKILWDRLGVTQPGRADRLTVLCPSDFLGHAPFNRHAHLSIVCNPPYSLALEFADACIGYCPSYAALLLRLPILGSIRWANWLNRNPPSKIRSLRKRPSFSPDGKTEPTEYAWIVWESGRHIDLEVV